MFELADKSLDINFISFVITNCVCSSDFENIDLIKTLFIMACTVVKHAMTKQFYLRTNIPFEIIALQVFLGMDFEISFLNKFSVDARK